MLSRFRLRALFLLLILAIGSSPARHMSWAGPGTREAFTGNLREAVNSGRELERTRKWIEAIEHYEKSAKAYPDDPEIGYGLRRSKIHFGIERRYSDKSFQQTLLAMSRSEAMALYDEIMAKVQTGYVDTVSSTSFVAHGTESLYLALADERFLQANVSLESRGRVSALRRTIRDEYWNRQVDPRQGSHAVIDRICEMAERQIGLRPAPIVLEYIFGGCNALDDYSSYLTPTRLNDLYGNIEGQFVGLGIEMKAEAGKGLLLVNVLPDSPAAEGKLTAGEHIVAIDGVNTLEMTTDEAAGLLQGTEGSRVSLDVERSTTGRVRKLTLGRRAVTVRSIPIVRIIDREYGIGYIQMNSFQKTSVDELDAALQQLRRQGMRSLVWDLRGNPGGLLTAAVEVLQRFISDGVLVETKGRTHDSNTSYSADHSAMWNIPLVVLIDGDSASASEIVAGAMKDHQRATLVGRKSYGKWSVQSIFPIRNGNSGLRLTTAKFYSPHGHTLGKIGVKPDVEVPEPDKRRTYFRAPTDVDLTGDADVLKALEVLQRRTASRSR